MKPLIIAISHGFHSDEFTCSDSAPDGLDVTEPEACRDFVCQSRNIQRLTVDEILVIGLDTDGDPAVIHRYVDKLAEIDPDTDLPVEEEDDG
jgi:hypothetical protein